jgi:hypothetical protein
MEEIKQWLISDRDYKTGAILFEKYSKNKILSRYFLRHTTKHSAAQLEYELKKLLGIPPVEIRKQTGSNQQLLLGVRTQPHNTQRGFIKTRQHGSVSNLKIPEIITAAKGEVAALYRKIAAMHDQLYALGASNESPVVKKRAVLLTKRKPLIARYETLYNLKEEYFRTQSIPGELAKLLAQTPNKLIETPQEKENESLFAKLTDIQLLSKINSLRVSVTRQDNMLQYGCITRLNKKNPMPDGPKKEKIIKNLQRLKENYACCIKIKNQREKNENRY